MKTSLPTMLLVAILGCHVMVTSATSWWRFATCLKNGLGLSSIADPDVICAASQMAISYGQMRWYQCTNCDKYFHCKGNYNAVNNCGQASDARRAAEVISNCREFSQGGMDADGQADDAANRHGRNGGNCESRYLCSVNCKFDPSPQNLCPDQCCFACLGPGSNLSKQGEVENAARLRQRQMTSSTPRTRALVNEERPRHYDVTRRAEK